MYLQANCKINLGLHVLEKRSDNYHNIETVFYPVDLCDSIEITEHNSQANTTITITGETGHSLQTGPINDNICIKAYNLIRERHKIPNVSIKLHKSIPIQAGLGGGSSDGATNIKAFE